MKERDEPAGAKPAEEQAGAIVVGPPGRASRAECPKILVVTARAHPHEWIFPKGKIEPGEDPAGTAVRELYEETGVEGEAVAPAESLYFRSRGRDIRVRYFLVRATKQHPSWEGRRVRWCTLDEALETLTFPDARELLSSLRGRIAREFGGGEEPPA